MLSFYSYAFLQIIICIVGWHITVHSITQEIFMETSWGRYCSTYKTCYCLYLMSQQQHRVMCIKCVIHKSCPTCIASLHAYLKLSSTLVKRLFQSMCFSLIWNTSELLLLVFRGHVCIFLVFASSAKHSCTLSIRLCLPHFNSTVVISTIKKIPLTMCALNSLYANTDRLSANSLFLTLKTPVFIVWIMLMLWWHSVIRKLARVFVNHLWVDSLLTN